jgi:hypothetical protein
VGAGEKLESERIITLLHIASVAFIGGRPARAIAVVLRGPQDGMIKRTMAGVFHGVRRWWQRIQDQRNRDFIPGESISRRTGISMQASRSLSGTSRCAPPKSSHCLRPMFDYSNENPHEDNLNRRDFLKCIARSCPGNCDFPCPHAPRESADLRCPLARPGATQRRLVRSGRRTGQRSFATRREGKRL